MKIVKTAEVQMPKNMTVTELQDVLKQVPATAKVEIDYYSGDQRDPSYATMIFTWTD